MFPFDIDTGEELKEENQTVSDYEIDFNTGRLTGRVIEGLEATVQWARIALSTERYLYTQYSWNHGHELDSLIGKGYKQDYIESEVKRIVSEALLVNDDIESVDDIECELDGDRLKIALTLNTVYGKERINV